MGWVADHHIQELGQMKAFFSSIQTRKYLRHSLCYKTVPPQIGMELACQPHGIDSWQFQTESSHRQLRERQINHSSRDRNTRYVHF